MKPLRVDLAKDDQYKVRSIHVKLLEVQCKQKKYVDCYYDVYVQSTRSYWAFL